VFDETDESHEDADDDQTRERGPREGDVVLLQPARRDRARYVAGPETRPTSPYMRAEESSVLVNEKDLGHVDHDQCQQKDNKRDHDGAKDPIAEEDPHPAPRSRSPLFGRSSPGSGRRSVTRNHVPMAPKAKLRASKYSGQL